MTISQNFYGFPQGVTPIINLYQYFPVPSIFVVGSTGNYKTIQSALNAANKVGGGLIIVQPGSYTENLILYDACHIGGLTFADAGGGVEITGQHTPPLTGGFVFNNIRLISPTNIFYSLAAGSAHLVLANAQVFVTNGYTFNIPNWTGKLESFDVNAAVGTNDGYVNNTGGSEVDLFSVSVGSGTLNPMIVSGFTIGSGADLYVPVHFSSGCVAEFDASYFAVPVSFLGNSTGVITTSHITGGASAAITMSSSANWSISQTILDSSNNPAVAGAGAGVLTLAGISFVNNTAISASLTLNTSTAFVSGEIRVNSDMGGSTGFTSITSANSTTISTGVGSVKMSSGNAATNSAWIKIYIGTTSYWIPAWTTNAP